MATEGLPKMYTTSDGIYYLSGSAGYPIDDFSSGYALDGRTLELKKWRFEPNEPIHSLVLI